MQAHYKVYDVSEGFITPVNQPSTCLARGYAKCNSRSFLLFIVTPAPHNDRKCAPA